MKDNSKSCSFCDNEIKQMVISHSVMMDSCRSGKKRCICNKCVYECTKNQMKVNSGPVHNVSNDIEFLNCIHVN